MKPISRKAVADRLALWDREATIQFCGLAQKGAQLNTVVYPTGLTLVRATLGADKAEVAPQVAEQLRADRWRIRE